MRGEEFCEKRSVDNSSLLSYREKIANESQIAIIATNVFPVAVETLGPLSDEAHSLIAEIGRRAPLSTADPRETTFLYQRISLAIQRFNAMCLANTFTVSEFPS